MRTVETLCSEYDLLSLGKANLVRVPFLIKGTLRVPPHVDAGEINEAFTTKEKEAAQSGAESTWARLKSAQVLREKVIDRSSMRYTGEYVYHVLPLFDPEEVIEHDIDRLAGELYSLPFDDVIEYLGRLSEGLRSALRLVTQVREIARLTAELPDRFLDAAFDGLLFLMDSELIRDMVDKELSSFGIKGSHFLDSWVEVPGEVFDGLVSHLAGVLSPGDSGSTDVSRKVHLRAMPTRQLHITAGNAPAVPLVSALRAIGTKSSAVIKSPYGATLPGALFALAAYATAPEHPLTRNLSILYWPGGEEQIEGRFFRPSAFDRIVVWGAPDAVASVRTRARVTKLVCLNPRYGMSWIGEEAFQGARLQEVARRAAADTMIWNQKACIASLVHYVEADEDRALAYAKALKEELAVWDRVAPNFIPPAIRGQIRRMRRGKFLHARWLTNQEQGDLSSAVIVAPGEFNLLDHPMSRVVMVRAVSRLEEVLPFLHHGVSMVGVFPESRRMELCDRILARGVTSVFPLGTCERMYGGMAHDGMKVLSELVDWKNR